MSIKTKFGSANINRKGYYIITSTKENNKDKFLHRLIYEDFWGFKLSPKHIIHHKNGNKLDDCILNLKLMTREEHNILHKTGENNPHYGEPLPEKTRKKISESIKGEKHPLYGKKHSFESRKKMSKSRNTTGYYRVGTVRCNSCNQGFYYVYHYYDELGKQKRIKSVNIKRLEKKVKDKGLEWCKI